MIEERTGAERLIDETAAALSQGLAPLAIYNDAALYQLELDRIFARTWCFVAHASEIPQPGDYVVRTIGEDPFIVVRDEHGTVRVLFDSCRHRGTTLCRADRGNASHFRCPYHGWTFRNDGRLIGVPNRQQAFPRLDTDEWGLLQAAQVDTYRGLIFACLDPDTEPLAEYLGDFRWYLDLHLGLSPQGMVVIGEPHRWRIPADWKSPAENFAGDSYHTQSLHQSVAQTGLAPLAPPVSMQKRQGAHQHVTECSGHTTSMRRSGLGDPGYWGYPPELVEVFQQSDLTKEQRALAQTTVNSTGTIFPNLSFIHIAPTDAPGRPPAGYLSLRQWQPRGAGEIEAWSWVLVPAEASLVYRERAYQVAVASFSPSGSFEQDDSVVWQSVARSAKGVFARKAGAMLNYQMGLGSVGAAPELHDWPGPGRVYDTNLEEGVQRTFLRHWLQSMQARP